MYFSKSGISAIKVISQNQQNVAYIYAGFLHSLKNVFVLNDQPTDNKLSQILKNIVEVLLLFR